MNRQAQGLQHRHHHPGHPVEAVSNPNGGQPRLGVRVRRIEHRHEVYASVRASVKQACAAAMLAALVANATGCAPQILQSEGFHLVGVTYRMAPSTATGSIDASGAIDADFAFLQSIGFDTIVVPHVVSESQRSTLLAGAQAHNLRIVLPDGDVLRYVEDGELPETEAAPAAIFANPAATAMNNLLARLTPADGAPAVVNYLGEAVDDQTATRMRDLAEGLRAQGLTAHLLATVPAGADESPAIRGPVNLLARSPSDSIEDGQGDIALLDVSIDRAKPARETPTELPQDGPWPEDAPDASPSRSADEIPADDAANDEASMVDSSEDEGAGHGVEQAIADGASAGKRLETAIGALPEQFYAAISSGLTGGLIVDGLPIETGRWEETLTRPIRRYVQLGDPLRSVVAKAKRWGPKLRTLSPRRIYRTGQQESLVETILFVRGNRRYVLLRNVGEAEYARETADIPAILANRQAERAVEVPVRETLGRKVVFANRNTIQIPAELSPGDAALWEVF